MHEPPLRYATRLRRQPLGLGHGVAQQLDGQTVRAVDERTHLCGRHGRAVATMRGRSLRASVRTSASWPASSAATARGMISSDSAKN